MPRRGRIILKSKCCCGRGNDDGDGYHRQAAQSTYKIVSVHNRPLNLLVIHDSHLRNIGFQAQAMQ